MQFILILGTMLFGALLLALPAMVGQLKTGASSRQGELRTTTAATRIVDLGAHANAMRTRGTVLVWQTPLSVLVGASTMAAVEFLPLWLVAAVGSALLNKDAYEDFGDQHHGFMREEKRSPGDVWWYALAWLTKWLLGGVALWVWLEAGFSLVSGGWHPRVLALVGVGALVAAVGHVPARAIVRRFIIARRNDDGALFDSEAVLFLRSFGDDRISMWSHLGQSGVMGHLFPPARLRLEEVLLRALSEHQIVAIGDPREHRLPALGALRTHWADSEWQQAIDLAAHRSRLIVLVAGATDGLAWELDQVRAWGALNKVVVVFPPDSADMTRHRLERIEAAWGVSLLPELSRDAAGFSSLLATLVAVRVDDTGITHHFSPQRDWAAYFAVAGAALAHLEGRTSAPAKVAVPADSTDPTAPPAVPAGPAKRVDVPRNSVEPVPPVTLARILNGVGRADLSHGWGAVAKIDKALTLLGADASTVGMRASLLHMRALMAYSVDEEDGEEGLRRRTDQAIAGLADALTHAEAATQRIPIYGLETVTPLGLQLDILDSVYTLLPESSWPTDMARLAAEATERAGRHTDLAQEGTWRLRYAAGLRREGDASGAAREVSQALELAERQADFPAKAEATRWRARLSLDAGRITEAREYQRATITLLEKTGDDVAALAGTELLARMHLRDGDAEAAWSAWWGNQATDHAAAVPLQLCTYLLIDDSFRARGEQPPTGWVAQCEPWLASQGMNVTERGRAAAAQHYAPLVRPLTGWQGEGFPPVEGRLLLAAINTDAAKIVGGLARELLSAERVAEQLSSSVKGARAPGAPDEPAIRADLGGGETGSVFVLARAVAAMTATTEPRLADLAIAILLLEHASAVRGVEALPGDLRHVGVAMLLTQAPEP